jgi:hypothetical protein
MTSTLQFILRIATYLSAIPNLNEMWEPYPGNRAKICPKWNKALVFRHSFARSGIHSSKIPPDLELLLTYRGD